MKFGQFLKENQKEEWKFYYLSYNKLKKTIAQEVFSEQEFMAAIEKELEKINSFFNLKLDQLYDQVLQVRYHLKDEKSPEKKPVSEIEKELDRIAAEMLHLENFQKINYLAFSKLLKKHDKHQMTEAKPWLMLRIEEQSFVKKDIDKILYQLSECYRDWQKLVNKDQKVKNRDENMSGAQNFVRKTSKYWVRPDQLTLVKTMIIKHLPIDVFDKTSLRSSSLITSVYYDNDDMDLYHERLKKLEGARVVRMRTYGVAPWNTVFVERKIHHDSWVGETSTKQRFPIKETKLFEFLQGRYSMEDSLKKKQARKEISEKDMSDTLALAKDIGGEIQQRHLKPTLTTRCIRTAFQQGRDDTVRMSLDEELHMIVEMGYQDNRWGRKLTPPYDASEVCWFPYGILEVKLNLQADQEPPEWISQLINSNLVIPVPKFSKYIHGTVALMPQRVNILPPWLPLLENPPKLPHWTRYMALSTKNLPPERDDSSSDESTHHRADKSPERTGGDKGKASKSTQLERFSTTASLTTSFSPNALQPAPPSNNNAAPSSKYSKFVGKEEDLSKPIPSPRSSVKLENFTELQTKLSSGSDKNNTDRKGSNSGKVPPNIPQMIAMDDIEEEPKGFFPMLVARIKNYFGYGRQKAYQMPMKIDPKTFFANERTLLHWLSFLVILQSVGIALMRFATTVSVGVGGFLFVLVSLVFMGYSIFRYEQRRRGIQAKSKGPWADPFGPLLMVLFLILAVAVNVGILAYFFFGSICSGTELLYQTFYQYAPNDIVYVPNNDTIIMAQQNVITWMSNSGEIQSDQMAVGDFRGITLALRNDVVYLGDMATSSIKEYNYATGETPRQFQLNIINATYSTSTQTPSTGINGLTFLPITDHPEGGVFLVASTSSDLLYIYSLPLKTYPFSQNATLVATIRPFPGLTSLGSLHYHAPTKQIYGVAGSWLYRMQLSLSGNVPTFTIQRRKDLLGFPVTPGIAIAGDSESSLSLYVACASCQQVWKFSYDATEGLSSSQCWPKVGGDTSSLM